MHLVRIMRWNHLCSNIYSSSAAPLVFEVLEYIHNNIFHMRTLALVDSIGKVCVGRRERERERERVRREQDVC